MYGQSDASYWEVGAIPAVNGEGISCIQFDCYEESLWIGTDAGTIAQFSSPDLTRHCTLPAHGHQSPIIDIVSLGGGLVSLSHNRICYHSSGGVPQLSHFSPEGDLSACLLDHHRGKLLVAKSSTGTLFNYDLHRGFASDDIFLTSPDTTTNSNNTDNSASTTPICPVFIKGPVSRGTLVIASANGQLHFIDPRNRYRPSKNPLLAHQAGFRALTTSGDLVATAGYALGRNQQPSLESLVKVFDVRMTPRMLAAIPFAPGPHFMEPHPTLSSTLLVGSAEGIFTLADTQALNPGTFNRVETEGDALYSGALSLTGEMLAFGGSGGYIHLWTSSNEQQGTVAGGVQYVEEAPELPEQPQVSIHDIEEELRVLGKEVPWYYNMNDTLASDYNPRDKYSVGMPPRKVDPELLKTGKVSDFVVYVENPHGSKKKRRGGGGGGEMVAGQAAAAAASIIGARIPLKYKDTSRRRHKEEEEEERAARAAKRAASGAIILPDQYRRVAIKRKPGDRFFFLDEFDFSSYNKSPYLGLENTIANCYMNALLQVLYFMQPMRNVVLKQMPDAAAEFNLTDELGFLFRMLATTTGNGDGDVGGSDTFNSNNDKTERAEQVQGSSNKDQIITTGPKVCQAANLFRALRQSKEAMALGLLEGVQGERMATDIEVEANKDRSLGRRVQTLSRFLLEQLNKEASAAVPPGLRSPIESIFGIIFRVKTECITQKREPQLKNSRAFQVELQYPSARERSVYFSSKAISASIENDPITTTATTTSNSSVTPSSDITSSTTRPPSFVQVLQTSLLSKSDMRAWFDEELGYQHVTQTRCPVELPQVLIISCGLQDRGDLIWWSTDGTTTDGTTTKQWLPHSFNVKLDLDSWDISISETTPTMMTTIDDDSLFTYDLSAVVAHVRDDEEVEEIGQDYEGHVLAHIKIPSNSSNGDNNKGEWHVFNDFAISQCMENEIGELYGGQKAPALLFFIRRETGGDNDGGVGVGSPRTAAPPIHTTKTIPPLSPIIPPQRFLELCSAPPLQALSPALAGRLRLRRPTFIPPGRNEIPTKGTILAIDAEFVQYSPAEKAVIRGMDMELRAARLGLARVSIIRGIGGGGVPGRPSKGVPIIDDYIRSVEPVHDYLTKYSGLVPGDLDPSRSPHHLTTLKNAYLKLRYLVDVGCIFVGHGLKQDFRMLNIVVPPSQVIDTLDLFYLPQYRRKLGLRFLTSYLLKSNIQQGTHDSIEDARAALGLYEAYKQLVAAGEGVLESKLKEVYEWGGVHGFDSVVWGADGQPHSMSEMEQVMAAAAANQAPPAPPPLDC